MEPNRFLFKLTAIFLQYFLLILVFLPIVYLVHLVKFNFITDEILFIRVLFFAIAFAMPFVVANAFSFANYDKMDLKNYLKSNQSQQVIIKNDADNLLENTIVKLKEIPFWKLISQTENGAIFKVKNLILTDKVTFDIEKIENNKSELTITSKPCQSYIFLDFGRNYRNILSVLLATKFS